jgi:hypothetical protein
MKHKVNSLMCVRKDSLSYIYKTIYTADKMQCGVHCDLYLGCNVWKGPYSCWDLLNLKIKPLCSPKIKGTSIRIRYMYKLIRIFEETL